MPYNEDIELAAKNVGYKTANLLNLKHNLEDKETSENQVKIKIPDFVGISSDEVLRILDANNGNWRDIFNKFVEIRKRNLNSKTLLEEEKKVLAELRNSILDSFANNQFDKNIFGEPFSSMSDEELVMVRSTGKEDSTDLSNPGGNDSFPSKAKDIGKTIGKVVASYFGERSLQQRLDADNDITTAPFCPVLVQSMVREVENNKVVSGVIYAGKDGSTKIDAAFGHGDLITSNKGPADNYYVSSNGVIYSEIKTKNSRIVSSWNEETQSMELVFAQNKGDKNKASLDEEVVFRLHETAQKINELYGRQMDIEFVYDESKKTIFVVQARAIVEGKRANIMPSSINPNFINKLKTNNKIGGGQVITPETKTAIIINDPQEIIICQTIGEALGKYQRSEIKPKAVIIQKEAASNSHEALEFNKNAVPVIQLNNFEEVRKYLGKEAIIIDPQHKSVFHVSKDLANSNLIQEGIFSSTLSSQVTLSKAFNYSSQETLEEEKTNRIEVNIDRKKLGNLLQEAKKGNNEAINNLLSFLYKIAFSEEFFVKNNEQANEKTLPQILEALANPSYSGDKSSKKDLARSLRFIANQYKNEKISRELLQQIFISGGEIFLMLDEMEKASQEFKSSYEEKSEFKEEVKESFGDKIVENLTYLNSLEKFTGLFKALPKKGTLSESLVTQFQEKKHKNEVTKHNSNLSGESLQYYLETTKLSKFLIKEEHRKNWIEFCAAICVDEEKAKMLGTIVEIVVKNNIHQDWINNIFVGALEKENSNNDKILLTLLKSLPSAEKFAEFNLVDVELEKMNSQISSWGEPQNFDKLYASLKDSLAIINQNLQYNPQDSEVEKIITRQKAFELIDVMDRTIKKVMKSNSYQSDATQTNEEYQQQCSHSKALVGEFFEIMKSWSQHTDFNSGIKNFMISEIDRCFSNISMPFRSGLLAPSVNFSVGSATFDCHTTEIGFKRCFSEKENNLNLEDFFTLAHQNCLTSISNLSTDYNYAIKNHIPDLVKNICNNIELLKPYEMAVNSPKLIYSELKYPTHTLHYNIPLRNHSATCYVKYDIDNKEKAEFGYKVFGINSNKRWNVSNMLTNYVVDASDNEIKFTQDPCHDKDDYFSFAVAIENEEVSKEIISNLMQDLLKITFEVESIININGIFSKEEYLDKLKNLNSEKLLLIVKKIEDFGNDYCNSIMKFDLALMKYLVTKDEKSKPDIISKANSFEQLLIFYELGIHSVNKCKEQQYLLDRYLSDKSFRKSDIDYDFLKAAFVIGATSSIIKDGLTPASLFFKSKKNFSISEEEIKKLPKELFYGKNADETTVFSQIKNSAGFKILFDKGLKPIEEDKKHLQEILFKEVNEDCERYIESIKVMLEAGIELNDFDKGLTAASILVQKTNSYELEKLVSELPRSALEAKNRDGTTAFSQIKDSAGFKILFDSGLKQTEEDKEHLQQILFTEVNKSEYQRNVDNIIYILEAGIDLNDFDEGLTAASILVRNTNYKLGELVQKLPKEALEAQNRDGTTVFSYIEDSKDFCILYEKGLQPIEPDNKKLLQILTSEISRRSYGNDNLKFLVQNYPENLKNYKDETNRSFAALAANQNNFDCLVLLAENGFDCVSFNEEGLTPFSVISKNLYSSTFYDLIDKAGKNQNIKNLISAQNKDGTTACSYIKSTEDLLRTLLVIKPTTKDLERFPEIVKSFIDENKYYEVSEMERLGFININTKCGDKTIGDLLKEKEDSYNKQKCLEKLENKFKDQLPDIIEKRIGILSSAIIDAATTSENFSPKAQEKLRGFTAKIKESLTEKYASNIKQLKEDFGFFELSDIENSFSLNQNEKVQALGKSLLEQIGVKDSKKFNISCVNPDLKSVNTNSYDEFKFSLDENNSVSNNESNLVSSEEQKEQEFKVTKQGEIITSPTQPSSQILANSASNIKKGNNISKDNPNLLTK